MEFQMKTDDQEKACWPIVRLVRGIVKRDYHWIAVGAKVCTGRLIPEGMLVDQMKKPCR